MNLYLILDNIRSMQNVGAIFRTADAVGVSKLYLCGITPRPPRVEIDKTALGAVDTVPWEYRENTVELISKLRALNVEIIALEQSETSLDYNKFEHKFPLAVIVGNEIEGIGEEVLKLADKIVELPMRGTKNSLNVAVATGIILYKVTE